MTAVITDLDTGEAFDYSAEKNNIRTGSVIFLDAPERDETHYYSHSYKVEVFGIKSKSGEQVKIEYTVNFYDKFESVVSPSKAFIFREA